MSRILSYSVPQSSESISETLLVDPRTQGVRILASKVDEGTVKACYGWPPINGGTRLCRIGFSGLFNE